MVKKKEDIKITDEILEQIQPLRGRVFKSFMKMGKDMDDEESTDVIFGVFVKESLQPLGIEIDDAYDDLSLTDFTAVLAKVMELNNMDELFQTINRLTRYSPSGEPVTE
jgi:hypothetical protein